MSLKIPDDFTGRNQELVKKFQTSLELKGIKDSTISNKIWKVRGFARYFNNRPLDEMGKDEVEEYILNSRKTKKPTTAHNEMIEIRVFYNWLVPDNDYFDNLKRGKQTRSLPTGDPIKPKDIRQLLHVCKTQRDRALVSVTYDSGARISEVLGLNVGDVVFDQYGAIVTVDGKTGMRRIRLVDSVPEVQLWLNQHPYRDNPQAPLFTRIQKTQGKHDRIGIRGVQNLLNKLAEDAELKKNLHPHALRHGRLTELVKLGMKEMELRIFAGWEPGSDMPATYLHLSGEDVDKRILAMHGITPEEDKPTKDETLTPQKCPRCLHVNPADAKYCMQCSLVLDAKKAQDVEAFEDKSADLLRELLGSEDGQRLLSAIKKMEK